MVTVAGERSPRSLGASLSNLVRLPCLLVENKNPTQGGLSFSIMVTVAGVEPATLSSAS